jgi:hypothetical protein
MKSLRFQLFLFCAFFLGQNTISLAQAVSEKKLQGGVTGSVGLNFPKMGTNLLGSSPGFSSSFGVCFTKASKESQNIALSGGVEFDIDRISYNVSDQDVFYRFTDKQIKPKGETVSTDLFFNLTERTYEPLYLALPIGLTFRTDFIGDYRGILRFGLRNRFLLTNTVDDQGYVVPFAGSINGSAEENLGMKVSKDLFFYNANLGISAGVEWNFSGSTCLVAEVGYSYGFMPLHLTGKEQNYTLFTLDQTTQAETYFRNQATLNQAHLKFTLLF